MGKTPKGNQSSEFFCYCSSNICLWFMPGFQPLLTTHLMWGTVVCCLPAWTSAPLSGSEPLLTIVNLSCFLFTHIFSPYYWCPFGKPICYLVHIVLGILAGHSNLTPGWSNWDKDGKQYESKRAKPKVFIGTWQERLSLSSRHEVPVARDHH